MEAAFPEEEDQDGVAPRVASLPIESGPEESPAVVAVLAEETSAAVRRLHSSCDKCLRIDHSLNSRSGARRRTAPDSIEL